MARYGVSLPIVGKVYVEVEADNEEDAIKAAFESDMSFNDIEEWEALRNGCRGNVCSLPTHSAEVFKIDG